MFDAIPLPDTVLWNRLVTGLSSSEALEAFVGMAGEGLTWPDSTTLAFVLPAAAEVADMTMGRCVHAYGEKCGLA